MEKRPLAIGAVVMNVTCEAGWAVVQALREAGAVVAAFTPLYQAGGGLSGRGFTGHCDTADPERTERALGLAVERLHNLRLLVNLPDRPLEKSFADSTLEDFDRAIEGGLTYVVRAVRAVAPAMMAAGGGSIVNVVSPAWQRPGSGRALYAAAQGGVEAYTRAIVNDLGPARGVRANTLVMDGSGGRALGEAILFLAGEEGAMIAGQTIEVNEFADRGGAQ